MAQERDYAWLTKELNDAVYSLMDWYGSEPLVTKALQRWCAEDPVRARGFLFAVHRGHNPDGMYSKSYPDYLEVLLDIPSYPRDPIVQRLDPSETGLDFVTGDLDEGDRSSLLTLAERVGYSLWAEDCPERARDSFVSRHLRCGEVGRIENQDEFTVYMSAGRKGLDMTEEVAGWPEAPGDSLKEFLPRRRLPLLSAKRLKRALLELELFSYDGCENLDRVWSEPDLPRRDVDMALLRTRFRYSPATALLLATHPPAETPHDSVEDRAADVLAGLPDDLLEAATQTCMLALATKQSPSNELLADAAARAGAELTQMISDINRNFGRDASISAPELSAGPSTLS